MWLHPWFFSMCTLHLGQILVLAKIQFTFSLSPSSLLYHFSRSSQLIGLWSSLEQLKHQTWPQIHRIALWALAETLLMTFVQPGDGHHLRSGRQSTTDPRRKRTYSSAFFAVRKRKKTLSGMTCLHLCDGQRLRVQAGPLSNSAVHQLPQQSEQYLCPQERLSMSSESQKQRGHSPFLDCCSSFSSGRGNGTPASVQILFVSENHRSRRRALFQRKCTSTAKAAWYGSPVSSISSSRSWSYSNSTKASP
mmetsp:Transcript_20726/g.50856  ORF Transcript_20726/g.50856 Transcript_20726/m.50856 type:complete len:249 (+) Transcript_20726:896-1642(+)